MLIFFLSGSFEDMGMFHVFTYLSVMGRYTPPPSKLNWNTLKMPIPTKLPLKKKINTVQNLITFSIVFTNKDGGGGRFKPPPSKQGVFNTTSKLRLRIGRCHGGVLIWKDYHDNSFEPEDRQLAVIPRHHLALSSRTAETKTILCIGIIFIRGSQLNFFSF